MEAAISIQYSLYLYQIGQHSEALRVTFRFSISFRAHCFGISGVISRFGWILLKAIACVTKQHTSEMPVTVLLNNQTAPAGTGQARHLPCVLTSKKSFGTQGASRPVAVTFCVP